MVFNNNTLITVTEHDADGTTWHVFEEKGRKIMVKFDLDESRRELALPEEPESQLESPPKPLTETQTEQGPQCEQQSKPQSEPCPEAQPEIEDALQPKSQSEPQPEPLPEQVKCAAQETRSDPVLPAEPEPQSPPKGHTETHTELESQCEEQSKPQSVPSSEAQPEIEDTLQHKSHPETQLELDPLHVELNNAAKEADKVESIRDRLGVSVTFLKGLLKIGNVAKDVSRSSQTRPPTDYE